MEGERGRGTDREWPNLKIDVRVFQQKDGQHRNVDPGVTLSGNEECIRGETRVFPKEALQRQEVVHGSLA